MDWKSQTQIDADGPEPESISPRFPYSERIEIVGHTTTASRLVELLEPHLTASRRERIDQVVRNRTYNIATVFDGPYDRGNVSALIRTAEGLGFQPLHVIETEDDFKEANRVTRGADKWVDIFSWERPADCVSYLRDRGYRIFASDLNATATLETLDFSEPAALIFGNEKDGVSEHVLSTADERFIIPIPGFTQSFNVSVAAAIALYTAYRRRGQNHGDMTAKERQILKAHYYMRSVPHPDKLIPGLLERVREDESD